MSGWYWPFVIGMWLFILTGYSDRVAKRIGRPIGFGLGYAIGWVEQSIKLWWDRHWTQPLEEKKAYNEWLDACLVAQHEKNIVLEAELLCIEALLDGDR
jgi:hypothetical protein